MSPLTEWASFYVIVGSAAAVLTGLMFVVVTLIAGAHVRESGGIAVFSTPTVVDFGATLLVAALLSAPWPSLAPAGIALGLTGLGGVAYVGGIVVRRARRLTAYRPVAQDWVWYALMPGVAYATLFVAALLLPAQTTPALFALGATTLLLLLVGVHNSWDIVTYLALEYRQTRDQGDEDDEGKEE
jgi:hypothetical protein